MTCDKCGKKTYALAQYAYGWGGAFDGGLYGPFVCDECAPPGAVPISARVSTREMKPRGDVSH